MQSIAQALAASKFPRIIGHIMLDRRGELCAAPTIRCTPEDQLLLALVS